MFLWQCNHSRKKNDRIKVTFRIKVWSAFTRTLSKTKQNEIELVVLGSHTEETAFARTCITKLAACDVWNASTSPAKAQGQLLLLPPGSTLTFLVDSSFVNQCACTALLSPSGASKWAWHWAKRNFFLLLHAWLCLHQIMWHESKALSIDLVLVSRFNH